MIAINKSTIFLGGGNGAIQKGDPGNRGQGRGAGHGGILRPLDLPRILEPPQRGRAKRGKHKDSQLKSKSNLNQHVSELLLSNFRL